MTVWNFSCVEDSTSYDMEIGPSEGISLTFRRPQRFGYMPSNSENAVAMMGYPDAISGSLNGTSLTEEQYDAMTEWWQKSYKVHITDRVGRTFITLITALDRTREYSSFAPWKHKWTMSIDVLQITIVDEETEEVIVILPFHLTWASAEGTWDDHPEAWTEA